MNELLSTLVSALREELQQYGEMLAQLDQQQELLLQRAADRLVDCAAGLEAQAAAVEEARQYRGQCQRELARSLCLPEEAPFSEIVSALEKDFQPLLQALVDENNSLLSRVRQRSRQNHLLLLRSLQFMNHLVGVLVPRGTTTYNGAGVIHGPPMRSRSIYEAVS